MGVYSKEYGEIYIGKQLNLQPAEGTCDKLIFTRKTSPCVVCRINPAHRWFTVQFLKTGCKETFKYTPAPRPEIEELNGRSFMD